VCKSKKIIMMLSFDFKTLFESDLFLGRGGPRARINILFITEVSLEI
jgi:hypothetical protein